MTLIQQIARVIKDTSDKTPYQVRYEHKSDTWEIWNFDTVHIVNIKSHDDAENSCEQMNYEFIARKVVEEIERPEHWIRVDPSI